MAQTILQYGAAYVLVDSSRAGPLSPETRRWIAEWNKAHRISGVAIYGSSLVMRALFTLVLQAISLLRRQPVPYSFLKTEGEAREWLTTLPRPWPVGAAGPDRGQ